MRKATKKEGRKVSQRFALRQLRPCVLRAPLAAVRRSTYVKDGQEEECPREGNIRVLLARDGGRACEASYGVHTTRWKGGPKRCLVSLREERKNAAPEAGPKGERADKRGAASKADAEGGTDGRNERRWRRRERERECVRAQEGSWSTTEELTTAFQSG